VPNEAKQNPSDGGAERGGGSRITPWRMEDARKCLKAQSGHDDANGGNKQMERPASQGLTARCIFLRNVAVLQQITCNSCCVLTGHG
jgi:hypothetical protein